MRERDKERERDEIEKQIRDETKFEDGHGSLSL